MAILYSQENLRNKARELKQIIKSFSKKSAAEDKPPPGMIERSLLDYIRSPQNHPATERGGKELGNVLGFLKSVGKDLMSYAKDNPMEAAKIAAFLSLVLGGGGYAIKNLADVIAHPFKSDIEKRFDEPFINKLGKTALGILIAAAPLFFTKEKTLMSKIEDIERYLHNRPEAR